MRLPAGALPSRGERARLALSGAGLGLVLAALDSYWGHAQGMLALGMLLLGSGTAQAAEYSRAARLLRKPRLPNALLVSAPGYADRGKMASEAADRIAFPFGLAALAAGAVALLPQARHPAFFASGLAALALEAWAFRAAFRWAIARDWIAPSRKPFHGRAESEGSGSRRGGSAWLAFSGRTIGRVAALLPSPYAWLIRRKALHVFREDPPAPILFALLAAGSAAAFRASGNLFLCGFFSLAGCMAALCLARRAASPCDRFAFSHGYLYPPRRVLFRCDWAAALALAAPFPAYFFACAVSLLGWVPALRSQSVWQMAISAAGFACLIAKDGHVPGRGESAQALLAAGYLGIAGVLFMFPGYGLALAAMAAAGSAIPCAKAARD